MNRRILLKLLAPSIPFVTKSLLLADEAPTVPVTGKARRGVERFDLVMLKHLERIGCTAATLAISGRGKLQLSRGYGWRDEARTVPTDPTTLIGIASCEKPLTSAAIRNLVRERRLGLDDSALKSLNVTPSGEVVDDRVWDVTIKHLLEHKSGFDGDPFVEILYSNNNNGNLAMMKQLIAQLATRKLKAAPGTKYEYCNFGFDMLRYIVATASGTSSVDYFRNRLFRPKIRKAVTGLSALGSPVKEDDPPRIWNQDGGPVYASAPTLCLFMENFWLSGERRSQGNGLSAMYGSLPGSTAIMVWGRNQVNIAALFNGRGDATHDEIRADLEGVIAGR